MGHNVELWEKGSQIGGQLNLAVKIPGKEDFQAMLDYFKSEVQNHGVKLKLGMEASAADVIKASPDVFVLATGVTPRIPAIEGIDHPKVKSYYEVLSQNLKLDGSLALVGAGGIGFDMVNFFTESSHNLKNEPDPEVIAEFCERWGIDMSNATAGGFRAEGKKLPSPMREIHLLQRKPGRLGAGLGKTTGWIHRTHSKDFQVKKWAGVSYQKIDDEGLHILHQGEPHVLKVDHVVICAGQVSYGDQIFNQVSASGIVSHKIGGSELAAELDAKRAIRQGFTLARSLN